MLKSQTTGADELARWHPQFHLELGSAAAVSHEGAAGCAQLLDSRQDPIDVLRSRR